MSAPAIVASVTQPLLKAALDRLVRDSVDPQSAAADFQAMLADGSLRLDDFHAARCPQTDAILGTIFAQRLGGAQAALWLPVADDDALADALATAATEHLNHNGCRILQAVVPIPHPPAIAALARLGFRYATDLVFLARDIVPCGLCIPAPRMSFEPAAADDLQFAELIDATYNGSHDLPELNGLRTPAELLASCQLAARTDPPLWWFACFQKQRVGVLQLAPAESDGDFELVYMGFIPNVRNQGLGAELARLALGIVATLGGARLLLSRDVRNNSAGRIYDQLGFRETHRRAVWLKIFRDSNRFANSGTI